MKLGKIVIAYNILKSLPDNDIFSEQNHFDLFMLMKSMKSYVEFAEERTNAIKGSYKEFANENGVIEGEHADQLIAEIDKLYETDVDAEISAIDLPFVKGINYKVMCDLDGIVNFHMH